MWLLGTLLLVCAGCRTPEEETGGASAGDFWAPIEESDERAEERYVKPPGMLPQDAAVEDHG